MAEIFLTHAPDMLANYYGDRALTALRALGPVRLNQTGRVLDDPLALAAAARGAAIVVADRRTPAPTAFLDASPGLLAFCRVAVDISTIDVAAASRNGILVTRASPGFVDSVCELTFGHMIDLARGVSDAVASYRARATPEPRRGRQLRGAALGVIGYGAIGVRLAELGLAFGMTVLACDPHRRDMAAGVARVELPALLAAADFVVCAALATPETENLMNGAAFALMRSSAWFLNVSRGGLVDETALEAALNEGRIAGAALDVGRAPDQMPSPHLARHPRVIATPHIGGLTPEAAEHQAMDTVRQVADLLAGRMPEGAANPHDASRLRQWWTERAMN